MNERMCDAFVTVATIDAGPQPDVFVDGGPPVMVEAVDLLFVVDNSGSMSEEQASLRAELPALIAALTRGETPAGVIFNPITDLRVGMVSTDMGTGGISFPTCNEPNFGDDGILLRGDSCIPSVLPPRLDFRPGDGDDAGEFVTALQCLSNLGTLGCGFEQQLDAMLKAITPEESLTTFVNGTQGHENGANEDFVRDDSLLVIVVLTDEDDCSASNPDVFNPDSATFTDPNFNIRCVVYEDEAIHRIQRYVDGLLAVHPPERVVYHVVVGVPVDLAPAIGDSPDYDLLIGPEGVRDPRMIVELDPETRILRPSCNVPGRGLAFPPERLVEVAQRLERRGAGVVVQSICQERFGLTSALTTRIARHL